MHISPWIFWYKNVICTSGFWVSNVFSNNSYNMYNQHRDKNGGKNQAVAWLCRANNGLIFISTIGTIHTPHHLPANILGFFGGKKTSSFLSHYPQTQKISKHKSAIKKISRWRRGDPPPPATSRTPPPLPAAAKLPKRCPRLLWQWRWHWRWRWWWGGCWVKVLQLKTGCPLRRLFEVKLQNYSSAKLWGLKVIFKVRIAEGASTQIQEIPL